MTNAETFHIIQEFILLAIIIYIIPLLRKLVPAKFKPGPFLSSLNINHITIKIEKNMLLTKMGPRQKQGARIGGFVNHRGGLATVEKGTVKYKLILASDSSSVPEETAIVEKDESDEYVYRVKTVTETPPATPQLWQIWADADSDKSAGEKIVGGPVQQIVFDELPAEGVKEAEIVEPVEDL